MKQIHIVQSISSSYGGIGVAAMQYTQALAALGVNVKLFVLDGSRCGLSIDSHNENFEIVGGRSEGSIHSILALGRYIKSSNADIVHLHGTWTFALALGCWWAINMGIKVAISPHGCLEPYALSSKKWKKRLALLVYQKWVLNSSSLIFATSKQELKSIRKIGIRNSIAVLPIGVDLPKLKDLSLDDTRRILFLSRIHPIKGLKNLVEAWGNIHRDGWRLIVAGPDEGGYLQKVLNQIKSLGLEQDFEFPGLLIGENKSDAFLRADIFILPSYSESFGIVVAEALSYGVPVITTTGAPWEELHQSHCGWWVEPTVDGIEKALVSAMNLSPQELLGMGGRGRMLVAEKYSWDSIGRLAFEAYEWIIYPSRVRPSFINQET